MTELWADIPGYEGKYQVSNQGRVRSLDRTVIQKNRYGTMMQRCLKGQEIVPSDNGNGYATVRLKQNQSAKMFYVHRLVAEAFLKKPDGCDVVNHLDYDRWNNSAGNLEWTTQLENTRYSVPNMRKPRDGKPTSTGQKYITRKKGGWRLNVQRQSMKYDRVFRTMEDAIKAREVLLGAEEHFAG